jgi:hypothetical protein
VSSRFAESIAWGADDYKSSNFFGEMLALTPSLVLLAFLRWGGEIGVRKVDANLEFDDQPPYPNT